MKNPFLEENMQPYNSVPFNDIKADHFLPAVREYIKLTKSNIDNICQCEDAATFENTILALETSQEDLDYVTSVFQNLYGSEADDDIRKLIHDLNPLLTELSNDISLNANLFQKVKEVYNDRDSYDGDELRLINETYESFVRSGADLSDDDKDKYRSISQKLSLLGPKFSDNVLKATNEVNDYWIEDESDIEGLPASAVNAAKELAVSKSRPNDWCFSLDTNFPVLMKSCKNRNIRKEVLSIFGSKCNGGKYDNSKILQEISKLRHEKANLLGYDTHADFTLKRRMAESKDRVYQLIDDLIEPSFSGAKKEIQEVKDFALKVDGLTDFQAWDSSYYSELLKQSIYDFDEECLRPYFDSKNVIKGVFDVAKKLYGLNFEQLFDVHVYHEDVKVYKVTGEDGTYVGLLYEDLHPRSTKRSGAWMSQFRSQGLCKGVIQEPHVTFNCNLTKPTKTTPALLSINEVRTIFHEFGHCLHGLLTNVKYQSLGGMSVYWDFVELPSQILENWLTEPEVLNMYAKHYETGEVMPKEYVDKINQLKTYMAGSLSLRQLQLCKIDMAWHDGFKEVDSIEDFEEELLIDYKLVPKIKGNAVSSAFSHIFAGGYSAGYYSYKWAELLEADAFEKFKEDGIFNEDTASSFRNNILSKGNTDHPMNLYKKFRGREPQVDALLRKGGLS